MKAFRLFVVSMIILAAGLVRTADSAALSLAVSTDRQMYGVGMVVNLMGSVNNGSAVPDALVLFEVDRPDQSPWIIRTFTTGQNPSPPLGHWPVELLNVTPSDSSGNPVYAFSPGQDAGFMVTVRNNGLSPYPVVITINAFFSNGLPFVLQPVFNGTLNAGQTLSALTWPVNIPANSVAGQAVVYASAFNYYPRKGGLAYSPGQSATFNITRGVPAQIPPSNPLGNFSMTVPLVSTPSMPIYLSNYTAYATTTYNYYYASGQATFTVKLVGDINGDGKIDIKDITFVVRHFGTHGPNVDYPGEPASPNWNSTADITGPTALVPDGKVDARDILFVAHVFGVVAKPYP